METFQLITIELAYEDQVIQLDYVEAVLVIVTQYGDRLWYIDINGVNNEGLLSRFNQMENIRVTVQANAKSGQTYSGIGYFHPNEPHKAAAIRGDQELQIH